ncbi:MAG TPA: hypothetical protein VM223_05870 [Planctomycetota bacterium]|nr:hypothetical protein [Planctomycetota bacterium]HUX01945.1 hypothetical protein [Phycisphaerae bacterium]
MTELLREVDMPAPKQPDPILARSQVADLLALAGELSSSEVEFVGAFEHRLDVGLPSTDWQIARLRRTWELMCR